MLNVRVSKCEILRFGKFRFGELNSLSNRKGRFTGPAFL